MTEMKRKRFWSQPALVRNARKYTKKLFMEKIVKNTLFNVLRLILRLSLEMFLHSILYILNIWG